MERSTRQHGNWIEFDHRFGAKENYGDTELTVTGEDDALKIEMSRATGRDIDNYDSSEDCEIDLNEDEVRNLLLACTAWLEQRA